MLNFHRIAYNSIKSTSRQPRWWILALLQVIAFSLLGELAKPELLFAPVIFWLIAAIVMAVPKELKAKNFVRYCLQSGVVIVFSVLVTILARVFSGLWVFLAIVTSLVASTASLAMLYIVLCDQPAKAALTLAIDTWNKKISLAAITALILILAHGISYALVHGVWKNFVFAAEFSVLNYSATIWVLLVALVVIAAFFAAILNCFLVLLFLEIIRREKDPEPVKDKVLEAPGLQIHQH
jgi:hypothetical protein